MKVDAYWKMEGKPDVYMVELSVPEVEEIMHGNSGIVDDMLDKLNAEWNKYNKE